MTRLKNEIARLSKKFEFYKRPLLCLGGGVFLASFLLLIGFLSGEARTPPALKKNNSGIRLADTPLPEPPKPIQEKQDPMASPTVPNPQFQDVKLNLDMPQLKIDYTVNPQILVGVQVPAPPTLSMPSVSDAVFSLGELDNQPQVIHAPAPVYPHQAKSRGVQGEVLVRIVIDAEGRVISAKLASQKNAEEFGQVTLDAVKNWRFKPGQKGTQTVHCEVEVPVVFRLSK